MRLLDGLEVTAREKRLKVARAILYMAQGEITEVIWNLRDFKRTVRDTIVLSVFL